MKTLKVFIALLLSIMIEVSGYFIWDISPKVGKAIMVAGLICMIYLPIAEDCK